MNAAVLDLNPTAPRPPEESQPLVDRRKTNPMLNDQKMKLGVFGANCSYGLIVSHVESTFRVTWEHHKEIAQRADALGFEALVPIARWRGFGGTTNFNGTCFETFTWAAGLAAVTEQIAVFSTSHLPTLHPIVAAKAATTVDHISGGRFGINLVMGWFRQEMEMFGAPQREHDERYAFGQEWLDYVLKLWSEPGSFTFDGQFFHGESVESYPKPVQAPRPVLVNAGNSKSGIEFSARNVDVNLASLDTVENMKAYSETIKEKARKEYEREIATMTYGMVVCRDTEKEAKDAFQRLVDQGDLGAVENIVKAAAGENQSYEITKAYQERVIAGWGGYPLVGTPEQVVEEMGRLSEAGMDGFLIGFIDYNDELKYFGEKVMPLMREAGLRH